LETVHKWEIFCNDIRPYTKTNNQIIQVHYVNVIQVNYVNWL
jgi:hypothetical protein